VLWLRDEIDAIGPTLSTDRQERLAVLFSDMAFLEVGFFEAAYKTD